MIEQINQYFANLEDEFTQQFKQSAKKFEGFRDLE